MRRTPPLLAALAALTVLTACKREPAYVSPVVFDTAKAFILTTGGDSVPLLLELARSEAQHTFGLMARPSLDSASGMAFLYDTVQAGSAGFWMWRTRMPLDIAFMDSTGVMLTMFTMQPCASDVYASSCDTYLPNVPYRSALEVNAGFFARHGVDKGARLVVQGASAP
jgi:uncharacterized membrane protein (UPF0127 family)